MLLRLMPLLLVLPWMLAMQGAENTDPYAQAREQMMQAINAGIEETARDLHIKALSPEVDKAMHTVPRHEFVPAEEREHAYEDRPLPIGFGQTISQPYIVAIMTELLQLEAHDKVLEIGTGSGYQAAVLSGLVDKVYTIEIIQPLSKRTQKLFKAQGYENITAMTGDGYYGHEEEAPYDAIIVTAGTTHIPPPLVKQLKPGGRMVIPVGSRFMLQELLLVRKAKDGSVSTEQLLPVTFVPLTGGH